MDPSIPSENGFMDSPSASRLMLDKYYQKEVVKEHVQGICKFFGALSAKRERCISSTCQYGEIL